MSKDKYAILLKIPIELYQKIKDKADIESRTVTAQILETMRDSLEENKTNV